MIVHGLDYLAYVVGETWHQLNTFANQFNEMRQRACGFMVCTMETHGFWHSNWDKQGGNKGAKSGSNHSLLAKMFGSHAGEVRRVHLTFPEGNARVNAKPTSYRRMYGKRQSAADGSLQGKMNKQPFNYELLDDFS